MSADPRDVLQHLRDDLQRMISGRANDETEFDITSQAVFQPGLWVPGATVLHLTDVREAA